jgi:hypothetical protein
VDLFPYMFDAWILWVIAVSLALTTYRRAGATMVEGPEKVHTRSSEDAIVPNWCPAHRGVERGMLRGPHVNDTVE